MVPTNARVRPRVFTSLQAGRAIAALMVVLYHCADTLNRPKYWNHSWKHYFFFGHSGVEIFFVLSGIVILYAHGKDLGRPSRLATYAWKRIRRIYPIYWLVMAFNLALFLLIPSFGKGFETHPIVILQSFLLMHLANTQTVLTVAWTLYHEVMFYAVFAAVIVNRKLGVALLSLWMAASIFTLFRPPVGLVLAEYLSPLHLLFGFGMLIAWFLRRSSMPGPPLVIIGALEFIACCIYDNVTLADTHPVHIGYGIGAALMLCGVMLMEQQGNLYVPQGLKLLGDASYSIYLVHFAVLSVLAKVLYPISKRVHMPLIVPFLTMAVVATVVGVLVHLYVESPLLRVLNRQPESPVERKPVQGVRLGDDAASTDVRSAG